VIAEMLGVPRHDWELLFRWTNEVIAPQDPEFQRGQTAEETIQRARLEVFAYFHELAERRRAESTDDIVSVIANGEVSGARRLAFVHATPTLDVPPLVGPWGRASRFIPPSPRP
jgi:cytochrome P450